MRGLTCWLAGCDFHRVYAPGRVFLRCQVCGLETEGLRADYEDLPKPRVIYPAPISKRFKVVVPKKRKSA